MPFNSIPASSATPGRIRCSPIGFTPTCRTKAFDGFAPHDLPIGAKTWDAIDEAIRHREKLLLILSQASIASEWVEDEVNKAYAEERSRKQVVLFPIRIDNASMSTSEPWAVKLRDQRNIGDFRQWKKPDEYQKSLDRLLRDLKASGEK
jgi:hypothetical protein